MISSIRIPAGNELRPIIGEDLSRDPIVLESLFQDLDGVLSCRSIEYSVTGNQSGRIVHERDEPSSLAIKGNHLPISLPHRHGVIPFISYPFPLFSFLHTGLHSVMVQKNPIDCIMGDVDSGLFLDLPLKEGWSKCMIVMCRENECFCFR